MGTDNPVVAENPADNTVTINDESIVIKQEKPDIPESTEQINGGEKSSRMDVEKPSTSAVNGKEITKFLYK